MFTDYLYGSFARIEELKEELLRSNALLIELLEKLPEEVGEEYTPKVYDMIEQTQQTVLKTNSHLYS